MSNLHALSDAQVVILAAQFISDVNVESLQILAAERRDVLTRELIYRLLLTLYPSNDTARSALLTLLKTIRSDFVDTSSLDGHVDTSSVTKLSSGVIERLSKHLLLTTIERQNSEDALVAFVIAWAHQIESTNGALQDVVPLVEECISDSPKLKQWSARYLLPLIRLRYQLYPAEDSSINLQQLESAPGDVGVKVLLEHAKRQSKQGHVARDLNEVVAPWIEAAGGNSEPGRASWQDVFAWIFDTSLQDFPLAAKVLLEWDGPPSVRTNLAETDSELWATFAQTALAVIYACQSSSEEVLQLSQQILQRFTRKAGLESADASIPDPAIPEISSLVQLVSDANLLQNMLLSKDNELTQLSPDSVAFLDGLLKTESILMHYKVQLTTYEIAHVCLSSLEELQNQQLHRILQQIPRLTSTEPDWISIRRDILWLRSWNPAPDEEASRTGPFLAHVPLQLVEERLLDSILSMGQYTVARRMYLGESPLPLSKSTVEQQVVGAIYLAFDNASNGNRSRGGVKRASDMLGAFRSAFPGSQHFERIEYLLRATNSLSFYQLTLQHGVPFRPVNIRVHQDPLDMVARVLEQDGKAYTKLDDLLDIGRNLIRAHSPDNGDQKVDAVDAKMPLVEADRRVTYLAVTAALAKHDFDTAYSYITTRISVPSPDGRDPGDDFSWRAVYAAGRYKPAHPPKSLHHRIDNLSKRMDLLSLSLSLVPNADSLSEILGQWRRCEEEMETLKSEALREERGIEIEGDEMMPGGFGQQDQQRDMVETRQALAKRSAGLGAAMYEEEAPLGLFDVARGAATALRRSAFPLNTGSMKELRSTDGHSRQASFGSNPTSPVTEDGSGRSRKRDMVSNMVTSGLVSGMGWVLGAQPVKRTEADHE